MRRTETRIIRALLLCLTIGGFEISAPALEDKNFDISEVKGDTMAHKIHGDGYQCGSFEALDASQQSDAVTHAKLASYAYQDGNAAYKDATGKTVSRATAYSGTDYKPLSISRIQELVEGTNLAVDQNGTIYNKTELANKQKNEKESEKSTKTSFNATILYNEKDDSYVITYRGTEGITSVPDVIDDATQAAVAKLVPQQYKDAATLLGSVMKDGKKIVCDGHSLGGGLVAYAMAANDIGDQVVGHTYNTAGLSESTIESLSVDGVKNAASHITNYRNSKDPVSYVGYHLGPTYEVTTVADGNKHTMLGDHSDQYLTENLAAAAEKKAQNSTSQDSDVDIEGDAKLTKLAEQMLKEYQNGSSDVLPENLLNDTFDTLPSEVLDKQDIANAEFKRQIESAVSDKSLADKVYDLVKGKIDEGIKKGEDWVKNGGIRETIQKELEKVLTDKVSDTDKQRILNLADKLCNVNTDGGKSLVEALGTDGKDLAVSLAINEMKKQLADVLPTDVADSVNAMLGTIAAGGTSADVKKQLLSEVQKLISEKIPYENSANTINGLLQDVVEGKAVDALDSLTNLGKSVGLDALKDAISKNLDPEAAAKLNALIDEYTKNGVQGLTEAALAEINGLIDKYAPGTGSAGQLKGFVKGLVAGTVTATDLKNTVTALASDGAKALIDKSNLPDEVKDLAKKALDGLGENGLSGMTQNVEDYITDYVSDKLGDDAGEAVKKILDEIVTPGGDPWDEVVMQAPVIGAAVIQKVAAEVEKIAVAQIDKLIAKYPGLKNVLDKLGIDGAGIVSGVKNVLGVLFNAKDLSQAITQLGQMALSFLKNIAAKLIDWALEWALSWLNNNLIPKVIDWASTTLGKWADGANNALVKKGLLLLQQQVQKLKQGAVIKVNTQGVGAKVINKLEEKLKKKKQGSSTTILEGSATAK